MDRNHTSKIIQTMKNLAIIIATMFGGPWGLLIASVYGIADLGTGIVTGTSITKRLGL